jgi:hypothetical protein
VIGLVARRHPIGTLEMSQVEDRVCVDSTSSVRFL